METLKNCYELLKMQFSMDLESYSVVSKVEEYRHYWKPETVKVILLGESHVFTDESELRNLHNRSILTLLSYPLEYVRFVYCLGHGENDLLDRNIKNNIGTPQYWKVLFSCLNNVRSNSDFNPILKSKTSFEERLKNKIDLLNKHKRLGVWLLDASIVALYKPGGDKPNKETIKNVISVSWDNYIKHIVSVSNPKFIICIGKDLGGILRNRIKDLIGESFEILGQPNARLSAIEHMGNFGEYYSICNRYLS